MKRFTMENKLHFAFGAALLLILSGTSGFQWIPIEDLFKAVTMWVLYISCGLITLGGVFLFFFVVRSTMKSLKIIVHGLNEGAERVASVSGQLLSSSRSVAEGANEQAAAIEETASSLEEISSMTRQNADNANQAKASRNEAYRSLTTANDAMGDTMAAMVRIKSRGEEIGKIIKTIDEIAFQTNLLALNAAVEAARAGEAGAGFAVVADEVRNLALRAANAAKSTQALIEKTVDEINTGSGLVEKTQNAFNATLLHNKKVAQLIDEIVSASNGQAQAIDQVDMAVSEMEKLIQQNAANAGESAGTTDELNGRSGQMKGMADKLMIFVEGNTRKVPATR